MMMETEEMKDLRHQIDSLQLKYKELENKRMKAVQENPDVKAMVGKYFKSSSGTVYGKILGVPQIDWVKSGHPQFNEYQYPCLLVNFNEGFISDNETVFVDSGFNIKINMIKEYKEISEEEFAVAVERFFEERGIHI
jgi:hypothetical protein